MKPMVLVVEDNPVIAQLWSVRLAKEGYDVEIAQDGQGARLAVHRRRFDVVLLDVMLPDTDGLSLCRDWKANALTAAMTIICVSALSARVDRDAALEAGADAYIPKTPYAVRQLAEELSSRLHRHAAQPLVAGG